MRKYADMINEYLIWYSEKTGKEEYMPEVYLDGKESEVTLKKAQIWKAILELCYKKDEGIFWFHKFILGDMTYAGYPEPIQFNTLWWEWTKLVRRGDHIGIKCSRQHGKSTYWTVIQTLYRMVLFANYNTLIESATDDQATTLLGYIVTLIEKNEFLASKKAEKAKWTTNEISYNSGKVVAKGIGSEVRGGTYDYIVVDDILRTDNKLSDEETESFIDEELEPMLLVRRGQIVIVGTPKSETDIFAKIEDRIELDNSAGWQLYTYPSILDWERQSILCPDRFTWKQLMAKRAVMGQKKFDKEFMCSSNSLVITGQGYKKISDVVIGDRVKTLSGYCEVVKTMKRKYKGDMYYINTRLSNHILDFTPEHPFYIYRNNKYDWINAEDLKIGDYMVIPIGHNDNNSALYISKYLTTNYTFSIIDGKMELIKHNNTILNGKKLNQLYIEHKYGMTPKQLSKHFGIKLNTVYNLLKNKNKQYKKSIPDYYKLDNKIMRLFGYYLAEGCSSTTLSFTFHKDEIELQNDVIDIIKEKFGLNAKKVIRKNTCQIYVCSKLLCNFFANFLGKGAKNKKIPGMLIHGVGIEGIQEMLNAYLSGDGSKTKNGYRFTTISPRLIEDIREVSLICGKPCSYAHYKRNKKAKIEGRSINQNDIYIGTIYDKLDKKYGFIKNGFMHSKISKINVSPVDTTVYNLEIGTNCPDVILLGDKHETYCTPSGIVHNCKTYSSGSQLFPYPLRKRAMELGTRWKVYSMAKVEEKEIYYYMGVDVARAGTASGDYTVVTVIAYDPSTQEKRVVWIMRAKGLKIKEQVEKIAALSRQFNNPIVLVEKNNLGQDLIDNLMDNFNVSIEEFQTTAKSKEDLIRSLIVAFENEKIIFPSADQFSREMIRDLDKELDRFVVEITQTGNERFKGSGHTNDDMVISLALANKCSQSYGYIPFARSIEGTGQTTPLEKYAHTGDINDIIKL